MANGGPQNCIPTLPKIRDRRLPHSQLQEPAYHDRYSHYVGLLDFWKIVEEAFIRPCNITFNRHIFMITKQLRGEMVEHFYGKLKELEENCDFENKEETLIRGVFITNLMEPEIQKELLKQTVEPRQALVLAINMQLGLRNQHQIQ